LHEEREVNGCQDFKVQGILPLTANNGSFKLYFLQQYST